MVICYQNLLQKIWWHWIKTWWKVNDKKLKRKIQWKVNKCWQAIYKKKIPEAASWPKSYSAEGWSLQTQFHKLSKLIVTINHAQYIDETSMKSQWKVDKKKLHEKFMFVNSILSTIKAHHRHNHNHWDRAREYKHRRSQLAALKDIIFLYEYF